MRRATIRPRIALLTAAGLAALGCSVSVSSSSPPKGEAAERDAAPASGAAASDFEAAFRAVDLTHPLSPESLYWPNGSPFEFEQQVWGFDAAGDWYAMARYATPEHLGTHLDAPIHFAPDVWANAEIPLDRLIGPAVVIDISARAGTDPDTTLDPADVAAWEAEHGGIPADAIVLVRSGWSERWPDWNAYYGSDDPFDTSTLHFPGVSPEGAAALVERGVAGVGIDTASIDPGNDLAFRAHRVLAAANIFNLENLTGLEALPAAGATILALPVKIEGGSGGQARVIALLPR